QLKETHQKAGEIILKYFNQAKIEYKKKNDLSPVTIADKATEQFIRTSLQQYYPDYSIIGEEFPDIKKESIYSWVIDPIDGTKSFIAGVPVFGSLIGLAQQGQPILGSQYHPAIKKHYIGGIHHSTTLNGKNIQVSKCTHLKDAVFCTAIDSYLNADERDCLLKIQKKAFFSRLNLDCFHYGLLAEGRVDLVIENDLKPFDYMASAAIVQGAGGFITDWSGNPLSLSSKGCIVAAASRQLLDQALEMIA
ncbi:MAG: inositol monophosphatase family protein, partial [Pseudomonadota bacterium]